MQEVLFLQNKLPKFIYQEISSCLSLKTEIFRLISMIQNTNGQVDSGMCAIETQLSLKPCTSNFTWKEQLQVVLQVTLRQKNN